jgi:5'-3' exonuclease
MTHGFLTAIGSLRRQYGDRIVFCWDYGLPSQPRVEPWRKSLFPGYKAGHVSKDREPIEEQLPAVHKLLATMGYAQCGVPGLEADDIIGILTASSRSGCWIVSTDRDMYQLLDIQTSILKGGSAGYKKISQKDAEGEYGISMRRWSHYLALGGDSSDGIHVLDGIGPKTALKWVKNGIDLTAPWERRGILFDNAKIMALDKSTWVRLQAAHSVATIPRTLSDPRIASYCKGARIFLPDGYVRGFVDGREEAFSGFCADRGMVELLARAKEFCNPIEPRRAA